VFKNTIKGVLLTLSLLRGAGVRGQAMEGTKPG